MLNLLEWVDPSYLVCFLFVVPYEDLATQFSLQKFLTVKNTVHQKPDVALTNMEQYVTTIDILKKSK
jgi:hypothetical protein